MTYCQCCLKYSQKCRIIVYRKCRIFALEISVFMWQKRALERKVFNRISRMKWTVILREDFEDLGGYDQVGRALRKLAAKGKIMKIGYGLYAKAEASPFTGELLPRLSLPRLAKEALERLKVETAPSQMEQEYNTGKSTQVPTGRLIAVKGRISRKIGYNGAYVSFEHAA